MSMEMTIVQKACCEAAWRALLERGIINAPIAVDLQRPEARRNMAEMVLALPEHIVTMIVRREIGMGQRPLPGGYSMRWSNRYLSETCRFPSDRANGLYENPPRYDGQGSSQSASSMGSCPIEDDDELLTDFLSEGSTPTGVDTTVQGEAWAERSPQSAGLPQRVETLRRDSQGHA